MQITKTPLEDLLVIEPKVWKDNRGYFYESYSAKLYAEAGIDVTFVQDNQSSSSHGVIRGLHYQAPPYAQTKLIRVLNGAILDVVVDLRSESPTYGQIFSIELSAENKKQLLVPKGFAHGFSVLSARAEVLYKCDEYYHKESEGGILYNDPALGIDWKIPANKVVVSDKDKLLPLFNAYAGEFTFIK